MKPANDTLEQSIRRRAFLSRDLGTARRLLALADEGSTIRFEEPAR